MPIRCVVLNGVGLADGAPEPSPGNAGLDLVSTFAAVAARLVSAPGEKLAAQAATDEADGTARPRWRVPRALPRLEGRWLIAFTILWLLALPLAVAMPVYSVVTQVERAGAPVWLPIGLSINSKGEAIVVDAPATREAQAAGVSRGDIVVSIDGHSVYGDERLRHARPILTRPEGTRFTVALRDPDGRLRTVRLTRRLAHVDEPYRGSGLSARSVPMMGWVGGLLTTAFFVPAAILLFRRRRKSVAALLSLGLLLISAGDFAGFNAWPELGLSDRIGRAVADSGWSALLVVLLAFPSGRFQPNWTVWLVPVVLLWALLSIVGLLLYLASMSVLMVLLAIAVANLALRYRRMEPGTERQQLRWVLFGFAAGTLSFVIAVLLTILSDTLFAGDLRTTAWLQALFFIFGPLGGVLIGSGLLVSLLRYRLYDAEAAISRSAGLALLTLALGAIFAATAQAIEALFELRFGHDAGALPGAVGAGLAVLLITPLHRRIEAWADRRFRKALQHLRRDLPACVDDLRETASMKELLDEVLARVEAGARAVRSAVTLGDKVVAARGVAPRAAAPADFPLAIPLRVGHLEAEVGTLLVGPRPDGSRIGKDEREALQEVADPVARAIRIVKAREDREAATKKALAAIQRRLTRIEKGSGDG